MSLNKSNFNNIYTQITQLVKTNARNINDTNVTYETVRDLKLTADVVTSVDLNGVGSGGGTVNIEIDNELNFTSENPVENRVITEAISSLSSNKLDLSAYIVDEQLNSESTNPVENRAIVGLIQQLQQRITELEFLNNIRLSYTTDLEVLATSEDLLAGSYLEDDESKAMLYRMFVQTNKWKDDIEYPEGVIVTKYDTSNTNLELEGDIGIYRSKTNVPIGTELTATDFWEDLTETYLYKKDTGNETRTYYHRFINAVPASTVQILKFKSGQLPTEQNVKIEWGDGTTTTLNTAEHNADGSMTPNKTNDNIYEHDGNGYIYTCYHDYAANLTEINATSKRYVIRIIGNKFTSLTSGEQNIISNIFSNNLQFYIGCIDVEGLVKNSKKILYVSCQDYSNIIISLRNVKSLFEGCTNLQYAIGFYELTGINTMLSMERMFAGCENLLNCDVRIAASLALTSENDTGNKEVFLSCENMSSRLRALLPSNGFSSKIVTLDSTFKYCKSIYINDISSNNIEQGEPKDTQHIKNILFNDTTKQFICNKPFYDCTLINNISGLVPDEGNWK